MKHHYGGGRGRRWKHDESGAEDESRHNHHGRHRGGRGGRHRGGRLFDYGELRLVVMAMLADEPRHGYELMKEIERRFGGSYTPSPGVIYPTLSWLNDMGYARIEAEEGGRKRYHLTLEGNAFLDANRAATDALLARTVSSDGGRRGHAPAPIVRAMENLKTALRLRLREGPVDQATADIIAEAIDNAAKTIEKSPRTYAV